MPARGWIEIVACIAIACAGPSQPAGSPAEARAPSIARPTPPPSVPAAELPEPVLIVLDRETLGTLSSRGLTFPERVPAPDRAALFAALERDLREHVRRDPTAGTALRNPHRLFDVRWLADRRFGFELAGVVNRIDRRVFHEGTCGETRLIYRLGYRAEAAASRMPMTVNVVFFQRDPGGDCASVIRRWQREPSSLAGEGGPLSAAMIADSNLKSLELDVQSVRWPGTIRPDLAGHAEYILRVFRRDASGSLEPAPLENQPDVERLRRDPAARAALLAWIGASVPAIDRGTAVVPEQFLATRATSVAPHGLARPANRPFRSLFDPAELASIDLTTTSSVRTAPALLRRLDALSCTGCHESRSLAGFHLLGEDPSAGHIDALATGISPHLSGDLVRRREYARALARRWAPDERRDFAEHEGGATRVGAHCGLGDPSYASWTCAEGLRCARAGDDEVGVCVGAQGARIGDACELVAIESPRGRDRGVHTPLACQSCNRNRFGFPGGLCVAACGSDLGSDVACGAIPALRPFNDCIARREPFAHCLETTSSPAALLACDADRPCRDDYVCVRTASGSGACIPPYFLFQLRVDGHPL